MTILIPKWSNLIFLLNVAFVLETALLLLHFLIFNPFYEEFLVINIKVKESQDQEIHNIGE